MRLEWLEIRKFRNLVVEGEEPVRLELGPGINVVLGPNGTGKTNLLELLAMLTRGYFDRDEEMDLRYALDLGGPQELHFVVSVGSSKVSSSVGRGSEETSWTWHVDISNGEGREWSLSSREPGTWVSVGEQSWPVRKLEPWSKAFLAFVLERLGDHGLLLDDETGSLLTAQLQGQGRFDESLQLFEELDVLEPTRRTPFLNLGDSYPVWAGVVPKALQRETSWVKPEAGGLPLSIPDLDQAIHGMGLAGADLRLAVESRMGGANGSTVYRGLEGEVRFADGSALSIQRLSYGQKRMFAFAWYQASVDVIIADELVNGLHHGLIEVCLDLIGERQAFLTSQNPLLLDYLEFDSAEDVRRRIVQCRAVEGGWAWGHMSEEEADGFFRSYEVGIQHVGELLRTKGLW